MVAMRLLADTFGTLAAVVAEEDADAADCCPAPAAAAPLLPPLLLLPLTAAVLLPPADPAGEGGCAATEDVSYGALMLLRSFIPDSMTGESWSPEEAGGDGDGLSGIA